jgi:hypothetical protein
MKSLTNQADRTADRTPEIRENCLHRHIKWFTEHFAYLRARDEIPTQPFTFFETLDLANEIEIPTINYQSSSPIVSLPASMTMTSLTLASVHPPSPTSDGFRSCRRLSSVVDARKQNLHMTQPLNREERVETATYRGFAALLESLKLSTDHPPDSIFFDSDAACTALEIPRFEGRGVNINEAILYAEQFFAHLALALVNPLLVEEARIARVLFYKFTTLCQRKEMSMVNTVFDLKNTLVKRNTDQIPALPSIFNSSHASFIPSDRRTAIQHISSILRIAGLHFSIFKGRRLQCDRFSFN